MSLSQTIDWRISTSAAASWGRRNHTETSMLRHPKGPKNRGSYLVSRRAAQGGKPDRAVFRLATVASVESSIPEEHMSH